MKMTYITIHDHMSIWVIIVLSLRSHLTFYNKISCDHQKKLNLKIGYWWKYLLKFKIFERVLSILMLWEIFKTLFVLFMVLTFNI